MITDGSVVVADAVEGRYSQRELRRFGQRALLQLTKHAGVLRGVGQHGHVLPVLGGAAHHGRAADVDVLDRFFQCAAGLGDGGLEGVEVDDEHVDGVDGMGLQRCHVLGHITARQQAAVHARVQRLHAAIQHLREARVGGDLGDGQAGLGQQLGGAAGGQQRVAECVQLAREFDDAGFVGNGKEGAGHGRLDA